MRMFFRSLTAGLLIALSAASADAQRVQIGVLGLFHSRQFVVRPAGSEALVLRAAGGEFVLDPSAGADLVQLSLQGGTVRAVQGTRAGHSTRVVVTGRDGGDAEFILQVPGEIARRYRGVLEVRAGASELVASAEMDLETAVASVVAAELPGEVPLEAAKAQAVAARSYFLAGAGRHHNFDFCDTTHCQFLREPPGPGTVAARAARATEGLVLAYHSRPVLAMYTRSCSGRTRRLEPAGAGEYPFFAVECAYCRTHPSRWEARVSEEDAARLQNATDRARLDVTRKLGWSTIPSDDFTITRADGGAVLHGTGHGHGLGLCQAGAGAMAEAGVSFAQILQHYYPDTEIRSTSSMMCRGAARSDVACNRRP